MNPGDITFTLKAPTGPAFTGRLSWAYHDVNTPQAKGNLQTTQGKLADEGRTLTFTHNPHLPTDQEALGYAAQVTALDGATPGRCPDGELRVGAANPVKLKGRVLGPDEDRSTTHRPAHGWLRCPARSHPGSFLGRRPFFGRRGRGRQAAACTLGPQRGPGGRRGGPAVAP